MAEESFYIVGELAAGLILWGIRSSSECRLMKKGGV